MLPGYDMGLSETPPGKSPDNAHAQTSAAISMNQLSSFDHHKYETTYQYADLQPGNKMRTV